MLGVQATPYALAGHWQVSFSWRYQKSFRHFVGTEEQVNRDNEGSEVINRIHLADLSLSYNISDRMDIGVSIPWFMGTRSSAIRDNNRNVIGRYTTQAHGISDITFTTHRWLIDPKTNPSGNASLGLGLKIPTGQDNVTDTFQSYSNGTITNTIRTVDQSIQPGDGGFGIIFDLQTYRWLVKSRAALYLTGTYMVTPEGTNGVQTYRRPSEAIMSIADQYLLRAGASVFLPWVDGMSVSLGVRWEGVPVHDLVGTSVGFRRPGYSVGIEPTLSYSRGRDTFSLAVPFAIRRNRLVSVPDVADDAHGDAAFADYLVIAGFSHRF